MNKKWISAVIVVIALGAIGGWWFAKTQTPHKHQLTRMTDAQGRVYFTCSMHPQVKQDEPGHCPICGMKLSKREEPAMSASTQGQREVLYWYDPMKPDQHFDQPGKSPFMDMQLVPKYADRSGAGSGQGQIVQIDPQMAQNLGMRTASVESGTFWQRIDTVGSVAVDEHRIEVVEARAAGWVERLDVRAVGDAVKRGQVVAGVYAPELLAAQEELALARKLGDATLIDAARTRLKLLNASTSGEPRRRTLVYAPESGYVTELMVRQGAQVTPGMPLMKLANLSRVWILVEVPEAQANWVSVGKVAEATLKSVPGKQFEGTVEYVYPTLDARTRTVTARLAFDNPDEIFKPGMYADVTIFGGARREVRLVPSEAVIRTGVRNVVIVAEAQGRYRPVEVTLGPERQDQIVVLDGLEVGQEVVVSGQFLIDSEASLLGTYNRMSHGDEDSDTRHMRQMEGGS